MKLKPLTRTDLTIMERLKSLRKNKGKTRNQVVEELEGMITLEQLKCFELENRYSEPRVEQLVALAKYYGVTTDYILGLTDTRDGGSLVNLSIKGINTFDKDDLELLERLLNMDYNGDTLASVLIVCASHLSNNLKDLIALMRKEINGDARQLISESDEEVTDLSEPFHRAITGFDQFEAMRDAALYNISRIIDECMRSFAPKIDSPINLIDDDVQQEFDKFIETLKASNEKGADAVTADSEDDNSEDE